jgi:hypothetical protein
MTQNPWGKCLMLNLSGCVPWLIRDRENILMWGEALVKKIGMKTYGEPFLERFSDHKDDAAGYTYFQAIETSNITAHFSEKHNTAFIHIFSCSQFKTMAAVETCNDWFRFRDYYIKPISMMPNGMML